MATIDRELRQIVKLSTWSKLDGERANYREFVRYKVPFAARIPAAAYAIDSRGYEGLQAAKSPVRLGRQRHLDPGDDSFGALVSDLVDGRASGVAANTFSFLDIAVDELKKDLNIPVGAQGVPRRREDVLEALGDHFAIGVSLWRELTEEQIEKLGKKLEITATAPPASILIKCFRLRQFKFDGETRISEATQSLDAGKKISVLNTLASLYQWLHERRNKEDLGHLELHDGIDKSPQKFDGVLKQIERLLTDPPRRFLLGSPNFDPIKAIIHGDLNARNLTWAQAFKRFFIIDFEHTGYGLLGVDQFRLVMSLLSDLWSAASKGLNDQADVGRLNELNGHIEQLFMFLDRLTDVIGQGGFSKDRIFDEPALQPLKDDFVVEAIIKILSTIRREPASELEGNFEPLSNIGEDFWKYMAFCAATKEFEYSLRDLNNELVEVLHDCAASAPGGRITPASLFYELHAKTSIADDHRRIAARFISSFCCLIASLPNRREL